jgi:hypothetical protein
MPWPETSSALTPHPNARQPAAVPSSDTVRRAALSASWARDRQVARQRLALRWLFWAWWRIGLPVLLTLALVVWLLGQMPPASVPTWLKPLTASVSFNVPNSSEKSPATALPSSENALHGKEP